MEAPEYTIFNPLGGCAIFQQEVMSGQGGWRGGLKAKEMAASLWIGWRGEAHFIERFFELQGEKGEPGAILTGDVPLERLRGQKVIIPPDPESTCLLQIPSLFLLLTMFI